MLYKAQKNGLFMEIVFFGTKSYEKSYFLLANSDQHDLHFLTERLSLKTVSKANSYEGICCFLTDCLSRKIIEKLANQGTKLIVLRNTGYDHVDLAAAKNYSIAVVHVPGYSPESIAEFAVGIILVLCRKILTAYQQGLEFNFALENLIGTSLYQKTVGIIGMGKIGTAFLRS